VLGGQLCASFPEPRASIHLRNRVQFMRSNGAPNEHRGDGEAGEKEPQIEEVVGNRLSGKQPT
jgi:hypothetical protein